MGDGMKKITGIILTVLGTFFVIAGIIGIFLPLLPTTPFLLLAAACYIRGSKRMYDKLVGNRVLGKYILNYREGKGIPFSTKVLAIGLMWLTMGYSAIFIVKIPVIKVLLLLVAVGVTLHLLKMKTLKK